MERHIFGSHFPGIKEYSTKWTESLFPPVCVSCRKAIIRSSAVMDLCPACVSQLPWRAGNCAVLNVLSNRLIHAMTEREIPLAASFRVIAPLYYQKDIPRLVRLFKFHGRLDIARPMADLMTISVGMHPVHPFDAVISVPLHVKRMSERGYNQAEELAKHVAERCGCVNLSFAFKRKRYTDRQSELAYNLRAENLKHAFWGDRSVVNRRHVLLVDDICTSGATLWSAMQALTDAGATTVTGLVIASGRKRETEPGDSVNIP